MGGLAASACVLLTVLFPRLKGSRKGILFFNAIAEYDSAADYANDIIRKPRNEIILAKLLHSYDLAKICTKKYRILRIGLWVGTIGAIATLIFLLLS